MARRRALVAVLLAGRLPARASARCAPSADAACPSSPQPVNDFANVIDPASAAEIERMIRALQAADRRRRRRRDGADRRAVRRRQRVRGQAVREPRPRHRREGQGQRRADLLAHEGAPGRSRGRLRPRAVDHRRLRRRNQPRLHGAASSETAATAPGCSRAPSASSAASRRAATSRSTACARRARRAQRGAARRFGIVDASSGSSSPS